MDVRGYPTGPIDAEGAFTSEVDLPPMIKPGPLNTLAEVDRPHFVDQPGMRHKYLPLRHDPATGALLVNPRTSVTQIALNVGFGATSAFSAAFHRITGRTPTDYRRSLE